MNKLEKFEQYLKKINISTDQYKIENFGSHYFYNASVSYQAILLLFDYTTYNPYELEAEQKQIRKYFNKNGLEIFNAGSVPGIYSFFVADKNEREAAKDYFYFEELAHNETLNYMHECYINKIEPSNEKIKNIMNEYENNYLMFLESICKTA